MTTKQPLPFFLAAPARSGSHFLMGLLNSTKRIGHLREYLLNFGFRDDVSDTEILQVMDDSFQSATDDIYGTKVDIRELYAVERYLVMRDTDVTQVKWIWLCRRDKVRQAMSDYIASRTGVMHLFESSQDEEHEVAKAASDTDVPVDDLNARVLIYFMVEDAWRRFFHAHQITPYTVHYEDFIEPSSWSTLVAGIFEHLEIEESTAIEIKADRVRLAGDKSSSYDRFLNQPLLTSKISHYALERLWQ